VLRKFFTDAQLAQLTAQIDVSRSPNLGYYPLARPGERFPVNDPQLAPQMEPRPEDDVAFLHGLLEGVADVESRAYGLLREMGASPLTRVLQSRYLRQGVTSLEPGSCGAEDARDLHV